MTRESEENQPKRGRGRPVKYHERRVRLDIRMSEESRARLEAMSKRTGKSMGNIIEGALDLYERWYEVEEAIEKKYGK